MIDKRAPVMVTSLMLTVDVNDIDVDRCVRLKFGMLGYSKDRQFKANTEREYTLSLLLLLPLCNS